jgi:hypothetical protein
MALKRTERGHSCPRPRATNGRAISHRPASGDKWTDHFAATHRGSSAPTARSIPAWANGPGHRHTNPRSPVGARHCGPMGRAFSPFGMMPSPTWAVGPGWYDSGPLALKRTERGHSCPRPQATNGQTISHRPTSGDKRPGHFAPVLRRRGLENPRAVPIIWRTNSAGAEAVPVPGMGLGSAWRS